MNKIITSALFAVFLLATYTTTLFAQRPMEKLDRSVVAQKVSNGVYVNWRIPSDEWYNTAYKLYRDGTLIFTTSATGASNYLDASGTLSSKYTVSAVRNGVETAQSSQASVLATSYLEIPLRDLKGLGKNFYYPNDATAADLDGDGQYEIIVKRMRRDWTDTCTDFTYFEAYKLDGTFLWAIDVGPNITMDVEINIAAFDFDGDGKAEVFMRSSDNTVFGLDINNQNGISVGDRNGDGYTNYRQAPFYGIGGDGFMNAGPEYLSLIDGMTGRELDWKNFIPRGSSADWGDNYGHRANKFFFGAPYLDGKKPSLFIGRGIYTQTKMQTYDVVNKKLVARWSWESGNSSARQTGKWDDSPKSYFGNGYHNYTIADVDNDGRDEINWGSMAVDDDGRPLYSTELGHGDAQHYGDFDPYRKGQEMFACNETKPGTNLRDAKTGDLLYRRTAASDVGRAGAGNITDSYKGVEVWGNGVGLSATDKVELTHFGVAENYCIYWDGDLCQELLDHTFNSSTGVGTGKITKFNGYGNIPTLLSADAYSCNYTKGTPCLQADIIGDWREEAIWWRPDSLALRVYTSPYQTTNRIYTLMHDHQYRQAICWQMCGYNQPPHPSYYLGSEFPTPIPAKSTNGKLVFMGNSADLDASSANFVSGDDAQGILAGTGTAVAFSNGSSILLDEHSASKTLNLKENLQPELLMIAGNDDYTISGTGILSGSMILDKTGEGTLNMTGNHTYTGKTDIWEGNMYFTGTLSSPVTVRRHAGFAAKGTLTDKLITEYNAQVYPGGKAIADTLKIKGNLNFVTGAKLVFDLSDNPAVPDVVATRSSKTNDFLQVDGILIIGNSAVIAINQIADSLTSGKYLLGKFNSVSGNISGITVQGVGGKKATLSYDSSSKELFLTIVGTRNAGAVVWAGKTGNIWDVAKSTNWTKDGFTDFFVNTDSVRFDNNGNIRTITLNDSVYVSDIHIENSAAKPYILNGTGSINGNASFTKNGTGIITLNTRNSFTGKVTVNEGTLVLKYLPSAINNGGIGTNITDPAYFTLKDSAFLQLVTANEQTSRGLTLAGTAGGNINVSANTYWDGLITGTKLTKSGSATLYIGGNNPNLTETVLTAGTIHLNSDASVNFGIGKKITLLGGTLSTKNSTGSYLTSNHAIDVPEGATATIWAGARCEYYGALTGAGTLNWYTDFIRANLNGNWSGFYGTLNILKNSANSTNEDRFIVNNSNGFPNANISIASGVTMCYKNGNDNNGTTTIKVGMLTGSGSVYNAGLEVGSNDNSGTYSGVISGVTSVKKTGVGTWTVTGANTYTGTTTVSAGTMTLSGSIAAGTITVQNNATFNQNGTNTGAIIVQSGGLLNINGTCGGIISHSGTMTGTGTVNGSVVLNSGAVIKPASNSVGTLNFKSNLTLNATSTLNMQVSGSALADKLTVTGTITCAGTLDISILSGTPAAGNIYTLFSAATVSGTFSTINLPQLASGLEWDLSELYTLGRIKVKLSTGIQLTEATTILKQNPTNGVFHINTSELIENGYYIVADVAGKVIITQTINSSDNNLIVDITNQPGGIYILRIKAKNCNTQFRLIKN